MRPQSSSLRSWLLQDQKKSIKKPGSFCLSASWSQSRHHLLQKGWSAAQQPSEQNIKYEKKPAITLHVLLLFFFLESNRE